MFGRNRNAEVFRCLDCDMEFGREDQVQDHVRTEHELVSRAEPEKVQTADFEKLALEHELRTALSVQRIVGAGSVIDRVNRWADRLEEGSLTVDEAALLANLRDVLDNQADIVRRGES